ncbi:vesicle-associated membrane protein 7H [Monocercomonoides exilis]|uniref:vesicle-associated membrane protein 7H n=1 Tax=Monocercomonoides exilis TaxID=2049356 RepID=UPI0035595959|nr:vesicle-associated membrane protein 7H [Monocercomonoides exilis]|eukprot:MONOS_11679.1-p1 / transcript=MONOS_11679.1 / gene=MONOS_11679 / organism=Monocercomonoides_exilis_PA203 / gene_product= vesicle-associated membrane protein 7H / transcript_product= vesicle-associated membrane protein 7H / location=Mono_scaffold00601:7121-8123(+) / protein_length=219 / sequence_SO=supercontig / SO=protein_coding / is_pseudo=false
MPVIYALIARGTVVLCDYATTTGNFPQISRTICQKIPQTNSKMSYIYEQYTFHYMVQDRITYLCMTDKGFNNRVAFGFLEETCQRFRAEYRDSVYSASSDGMRAFNAQLRTLMDQYTKQAPDKIKMVKDSVVELRTQVEQNIDKILVRQEKIELLVDKSENLNQSAKQYRKKAVQLKKTMWWKNCKLWVVIIVVLLIVIFFIVVMACGGFTFKNCKKK